MSIDEASPVSAGPDAFTAPPDSEPSAGPRGGGRRRLGPRSLTARLVLGVVTLVVVLVCAIGTITYVALRSSLNSRLDQQVTSAAGRNADYFEHCHGDPVTSELTCPNPSGPSQSAHEWVALLSADGSPAAIIKSGPLYALRLEPQQAKQLAADPGQLITVDNGAHNLRVTAQQNRLGLVVVTGLSTAELDDTLDNLVRLELLAGAAAVALALGATAWGVRRSLRNLYRVTGTAQEVAAELSPTGAGLDRRVPVTEEGTEVGQLAESMNTLLAAVETQFAARLESEQRLRQFLADASHELRTPLTSIRGYAELARMQRAAGNDTPQDNLDRIESEGTRMSRLVDDLLMLARGDSASVESAPLEHEPIDVPTLLDEVVSSTRAAFADRPIELRVEAVPTVLGDRDQLLRAIRNLVTNAAVHTAAGRPIQVAARTQAGGLVVTVVDGGPGLPPDQAARVFERFWRADKSRTRARGGTGLGMSIVAAIVQAHGGSVRFDSSVERGSTATVWLPAVD